MDIQLSKAKSENTNSSEDTRDMHSTMRVPTMKTYTINECFASIQGEGVRAGTPNVFVRFTGCNMRCEKGVENDKSPGNFDCDTEFMSGRQLSLEEILNWILKCSKDIDWLILTGGEPALQVDKEFCDYFHALGYKLAIETNGSIELPYREWSDSGPHTEDREWLLDWITVSPKVAEHCIRQLYANEVKYVRGYGQAVPKTVIQAEHYVISPAFQGNELDKETLQWCMKLVMEHPKWRLSCQQHKGWNIR